MDRIDRIAREFNDKAGTAGIGNVTISNKDLQYLIEIARAATKANHLLLFGDSHDRHEANELLSAAIDGVDGPLSQMVHGENEYDVFGVPSTGRCKTT